MRIVRPNSLLGRVLGFTVCFSLASLSAADGAAYATASTAKWLQDLMWQRPGPYTDTPTEIVYGDNPGRDPEGRAGMWDERRLHALAQAEEQWGAREGGGGFFASLDPIPLAGGSGTGAGAAQPAEGTKKGLGGTATDGGGGGGAEINTNTGNRHYALPIVGWPTRGDLGVGLTFYHNSKGTFDGPIGQSWSHSYDVRVTPTDDGDAIVRWGDGTSVGFIWTGSAFTAPDGVFDTLTKVGAAYRITTKDQVKYNTNNSGYLTSIVDRSSNTITIARDGSNKVTTVTCPTSRAITFTYSGTRVSTITDPLSRVWTLSYNGSNDLTGIAYPSLGGVTYSRTFTYNSGHDILTETDLRGKVWTFTYDTDANLTSEKTPLNHTTSYSYTSSSATKTLPGGQTSTDNYSSGKLSSRVDEASYSESFTYSTAKKVLTHTDKRGKVWTYTWDTKGNCLTKTDPLSHVWTFTFNSTNDLLTAKDPLNNTTTMTVDSAGHVLTVTDPLSRVLVTNTYDGYGQLSTTKNALNHTTTLGYNSNGDVTSVSDPLSHAKTMAYDSLGRVTSVTDALSNTESVSYDEWGRADTFTHPGSVTSSNQYDRSDHLTVATDELGHTNSYAYDDTGRLTSWTNGRGDVESYGYNSNGWRTSVTNGRNKTRNYTFTNRGELYTLTLPDSAVESWSYNANGQGSGYSNPLSQTISYTFDDAGRHTGVDYPAGTDTSLGYDDADRQTSMADSTGTTTWSYNNASELTSFAAPQGTINYTYDGTGRPATMVEVGVGTTSYALDNASRLTSLQNAFSETTSWTYDNADRRTKQTFSTGAYIDYVYDSRSRLTSITHKKSDNSTISSDSYSFDNVNRITSRTLDSVTTTYGYDNADQLTSESRTGFSSSYTYDGNSNRATKTLGGVTDTYSYDDADKLTNISRGGTAIKSYGYDSAGRTTSVVTGAGTTTLSYDYESRITQITYPNTSTNTFAYNGMDSRVSKTDSSGTKTYKRSGPSVEDPVLGDGTTAFTPSVSERASGASKFYHANWLGTNERVVDSSQATTATRQYDGYGLVTAATGTTSTPFGFAGESGYMEDVDSGLMLLGHRYYDSSTGRFLSRDPSKEGANWYTYVHNNPVALVDAAGLDPGNVDRKKYKKTLLFVIGDVENFEEAPRRIQKWMQSVHGERYHIMVIKPHNVFDLMRHLVRVDAFVFVGHGYKNAGGLAIGDEAFSPAETMALVNKRDRQFDFVYVFSCNIVGSGPAREAWSQMSKYVFAHEGKSQPGAFPHKSWGDMHRVHSGKR